MRDQHRTRQELFVEVTALRKQVADLKEAMLARRRIEDALRRAEEQLRTLTDSAPVGLCLFHPDGTPILANRPFAQLRTGSVDRYRTGQPSHPGSSSGAKMARASRWR
jgi:PAS domain-containing protein